MTDKKILLIGGSGFLGQSILNALGKGDNSIFYADINPIKGFEANFILLDILEYENFENIDADFDIIINLTGQATNPTSLCFNLNSKGINNIISFVKLSHAKLIHISSLSVYGSALNEINEEHSLNPETVYGSCKAMSEFLVTSKLTGDQYCILRLSNLYGNNQPKGMLAYILESIKNNDAIFFNNDGTLTRFLLHVDDAAGIITEICSKFKFGIFNYPGKDKYSIKKLIGLFEEVLEKTIDVTYTNNISWNNISNINTNKIEKSFFYSPKNNIKTWLINQFNKNEIK